MKRRFKQIAAATLSAAMVMAPSLTVLADAPAQTEGTGNILAYSLESVIVPTDFKVALNPQGLTVTTDSTANPKVTTTDQIVTFTYGVGNLSTSDMVVDLTLTVSSSEASGITFAASEAEVEAAEAGDLTMYLALVPSTGEVKTKADASFAVTVKDGANDTNVTAANMVEVTMTNDTEHAVVFTAGTGNAVVAEQSFELDKCEYDVKDGETVDFTTTQTALASKMEITSLAAEGASIGGFTIVGAMNENADWTTATVDALTFAPVYEVKTALEAAADDAAAAAEEAAATVAEAVNTFKTTHADVLALTTETVAGTEDELTAINAAITAFGALSADAKTALAAEDPAITADTLAALKTASEAAAAANAVVTLTATYDSANSRYDIALPADVTIAAVSEVSAAKVNDSAITGTAKNSAGTIVRFTRDNVRTALGDGWSTATDLTFTFTINGVNYTATVAKNG